MRSIFRVTLVFIMATATMRADSISVAFDLVADIAYSYSLNSPPDHERAYSTQPSRDREIGLMQGFVAAQISSDLVRGRVALQEGWFARANYAGADSSWRMVQEARIGVQLTTGLWLDAGIMLSHIGYESMIARDNLTLSRSLTADYTPYYSTGVSATWTASDQWTLSLLVLNGWQQIVDINDEPALGSKLVFTPNATTTISWSTFLGNEQPSHAASRLRFHNNLWVELKPSSAFTLTFLGDLGMQENATHGTDVQWYAGVIAAYSIDSSWRVAGRLERYDDPKNIYVQTRNGTPFRTNGASVNLDYRPSPVLLLRAETRALASLADVFPSSSGFTSDDVFFTVSASIGL